MEKISEPFQTQLRELRENPNISLAEKNELEEDIMFLWGEATTTFSKNYSEPYQNVLLEIFKIDNKFLRAKRRMWDAVCRIKNSDTKSLDILHIADHSSNLLECKVDPQ